MLETKEKPVFRMSSAGNCPRALSALLLGYKPETPPAWLEQAAVEGQWHEARIVDELKTEGYTVYHQQLEVKLEYPDFILLGHIDGKVFKYDAGSGKDNHRLLEIKSMSQYVFDQWMKNGFGYFPNYADQLTCYMEATGLKEALYIVKNRNSGYVDRKIITKQPSSMDDIIAKLANVALAKELYAGEIDVNSVECRQCLFKYLCLKTKEDMTKATEAELLEASKEWREGTALTEQGEALVKKAKEKFSEHTIASGIDRWRFDDLVVNLVKVRETISYPKDKLQGIFTAEQLKPASVVHPAYEYIKVQDLRRE